MIMRWKVRSYEEDRNALPSATPPPDSGTIICQFVASFLFLFRFVVTGSQQHCIRQREEPAPDAMGCAVSETGRMLTPGDGLLQLAIPYHSTRLPVPALMDELTESKNLLYQSLGDNFKSYLNLLKDWFKGILDKDSFDDEAHKILHRDQIRLHNRFLVSLLNKCQSLSSNKIPAAGVAEKKKSKKRIRLTTVSYDHHHFQSASPSDFIYPIQSAVSDSKDPAEAKYYEAVVKMSLCSSDSVLPDNFAAHLRMFVNVWESGLDEMNDEAVQLLNLAVRDFMKNIITSLIAHKSSFRTQSRGRFKHCFGAPLVNPLLVNSNTIHKFPIDNSKTFVEEKTGDQMTEVIPDREILEREAMFQVACATTDHNFLQEQEPISLWHLFHAMTKHPHCIPSHTVYSISMNRILNHLYHDSDS